MGPMLNSMRMQALRAVSGKASSRVGLITSYDPANYSVRVALQPEGTLTGWLPLCTPWVGNGWGMFAGPSINDMIEVEFFGDELESGYACLRLFNDVDRPLSVPSGEFWLVHKLGAFLKFTNAGQLLARDAAGSTLTMNGDGTISVSCSGSASVSVGGNLNATVSGSATANVTGNLSVTAAAATINAPMTINGNVSVTGNIGATGTITAPNIVGTTDVSFAGKSAANHKHSGVQTGAGQTGTPV